MPFECKICGKYYNRDSGVGYECDGCGNLGTIQRCEEKEEEVI